MHHPDEIIVAVAKNESGEVEVFLKRGGEVNIADEDLDGDRLLHHAARLGHLEMVKLLLAAGADIDAKGMKNNTPLHYALDQKRIHV